MTIQKEYSKGMKVKFLYKGSEHTGIIDRVVPTTIEQPGYMYIMSDAFHRTASGCLGGCIAGLGSTAFTIID